MTDFRKVTETFSVAPQIELGDIVRARAEGFTLLINNRPDGEAPDQPSSAEMEAAAKAAGLAYVHIPVRGGPTPEQVEIERQILAEATGPVLAWCRSGTRSRQELIGLGAAAGYDLSGVLG